MEIERPHWLWWALILPAVALLAVLSASASAFESWAATTRLPLPQAVYQGLLVFTFVAHSGEAMFAMSLAGRSSEAERKAGWAMQTLMLGYPSLRLLLKRLRSGER
jgi:hypothetical protein